jgi:hypothetical protein
MKLCCSCKTNLDEDNFCKNKNTEDKLSAQCKSCAKKYRDSHKFNYKSSSSEYRKQYRNKNKEHINELRRKNWSHEKCIKQNKARQLKESKNPELKRNRLQKHKKYYRDNIDRVKKYQKSYRKNNIDAILIRNRARQNNINSFDTIKQCDIINLMKKYNNKCYYCGIDVERGLNLHLDHKIPLSRSGPHILNNLVPSCINCNLQKGTKTAEEFLNLKTKEEK